MMTSNYKKTLFVLLLAAFSNATLIAEQSNYEGDEYEEVGSGKSTTELNVRPAENCTLEDCKTDDGYVIRVLGSSEDLLRDTDDTEEAHRNNRRVEISGQLNQKVISRTPLVDPASAQVSGKFVVYLKNGGVLWATEDPATLDPRLGFTGPSRVKFDNNRLLDSISVRYFTNYSAFIEKLELVAYKENDIDLVRPYVLSELPINAIDTFEWTGAFPSTWNLRQGDTVQYQIRAYGANGAIDETRPKRMQLLSEAEFNSNATTKDKIFLMELL